ncbi:hypothetical protein J5X98_23035 [Leptothermofonsia sichuanensis E412]|uniref:hypothetical protein n=1 Tax=Leptothermofonsia sichuanensis TaxID=2917832 RepID=UPI001CA73DF3|nr:hypothetical protein [Leptothermofonsia sichuanensis]QZZ20120.1 hypothetical protein J5X98_23035 [Leptothermofonsia sichuanensis E412]
MKNQWSIYQELELIPNSIQAPPENPGCLSWLDRYWQMLLKSLTSHFTVEVKVDYLERCFDLDYSQSTAYPHLWQRIWNGLNQPLGGERSLHTHPEPQVRQILDQEGHTWWQAYDPLTGQTTYLDSEEEVLIWLEERLYF